MTTTTLTAARQHTDRSALVRRWLWERLEQQEQQKEEYPHVNRDS